MERESVLFGEREEKKKKKQKVLSLLANVVGLMCSVHFNGRMSVSVMLSLVVLGVSE